FLPLAALLLSTRSLSFPYTTLFRSRDELVDRLLHPRRIKLPDDAGNVGTLRVQGGGGEEDGGRDEGSAHRAIVSERYSGGTRRSRIDTSFGISSSTRFHTSSSSTSP